MSLFVNCMFHPQQRYQFFLFCRGLLRGSCLHKPFSTGTNQGEEALPTTKVSTLYASLMTIRNFIFALTICVLTIVISSCKTSPKLTFRVTQLDTTIKATYLVMQLRLLFFIHIVFIDKKHSIQQLVWQ